MTSEGIAGVSCTGGEFYEGGSGTVTCHFPNNINTTNHNFNVVRYPFKDSDDSSDASGNTGDYVLLCNWAGGNLQCKVEDGFTFNHKVTSTLTLGIPEVTSRAAGLYVCQLVPTDSLRVTTCNLTATAPPPDTSEGMLSSIPIEVFIPVVAVLGALVLLFAFLFFCYCLRVKRLQARISRTSKPSCCRAFICCPSSKSQNHKDNGIELQEVESFVHIAVSPKEKKEFKFPWEKKVQEPNLAHIATQTPEKIPENKTGKDKVASAEKATGKDASVETATGKDKVASAETATGKDNVARAPSVIRTSSTRAADLRKARFTTTSTSPSSDPKKETQPASSETNKGQAPKGK